MPAFGFLFKKNKYYIGIFALIGLLLALFFVLDMIFFKNYFFFGKISESLFNGMLVVNIFALFFKAIFIIVGIIVVFASLSYIKDEEPNQGEYYSLLLLAILGMSLLASSNDLITLFISLELASLSSYALVSFRKKDEKGTESAMKFYIIGALSSAILLYGISLAYGVSGTTNISEISNKLNLNYESTTFLAIVFLIAGFGFKIAVVPFHMWAPDVYEGAPTTITTFLATASKKMGFVALFKVFIIGLIAVKGNWTFLFGLLAVITMIVGNIIAISQNSVKRMLAYSSIAQAGYILITVAVVGSVGYGVGVSNLGNQASEFAVAGGLLHILTHVFMKGGAFIVVAILSLYYIEKYEDYAGLYKKSPFVAISMGIFMLSLTGIPPFAGFVSKFVLFSSAVYGSQINGSEWLIWLAILGVINSALSLYYYARIIKYMFVEKTKDEKEIKIPYGLMIALLICVVGTILIGIFPELVIRTAMESARVLMGI